MEEMKKKLFWEHRERVWKTRRVWIRVGDDWRSHFDILVDEKKRRIEKGVVGQLVKT